MKKIFRSKSSANCSPAGSHAGSPKGCGSPKGRYESSNFWDKWYANQSENAVEWSGQIIDSVWETMKAFLDELPRPPEGEKLRICDLGCGSSNLTLLLRDYGADVIGVDFSNEVINANRLRHPDIQWECWDALKLTDKFELGYFDCVMGKTLIDCFMTRPDSVVSMRTLFEQAHAVLKDQGRMILLDKMSAEHMVGRGTSQSVKVDLYKTMTLRNLNKIPKTDDGEAGATGEPASKQMELQVSPGIHNHFVMRPAAAGSGSVIVWTTDEEANSAGIETGDLIIGFNRHGGKGMQAGNSQEIVTAIRSFEKGQLTLLLERAAASTAQRKTASVANRLISRRATSQSDYLRRLQKARLERHKKGSILNGCLPMLEKLKVKPDSRISDHVCAARGLFQ